jgi:hypothetical protein
MATYSAPAARLLTLCENGEHEQLFSLLQDNATLPTVLSNEAVAMYPRTSFDTVTQEYFILKRMLAAAARGGHVDLVSALLNFGLQLGVAP